MLGNGAEAPSCQSLPPGESARPVGLPDRATALSDAYRWAGQPVQAGYTWISVAFTEIHTCAASARPI